MSDGNKISVKFDLDTKEAQEKYVRFQELLKASGLKTLEQANEKFSGLGNGLARQAGLTPSQVGEFVKKSQEATAASIKASGVGATNESFSHVADIINNLHREAKAERAEQRRQPLAPRVPRQPIIPILQPPRIPDGGQPGNLSRDLITGAIVSIFSSFAGARILSRAGRGSGGRGGDGHDDGSLFGPGGPNTFGVFLASIDALKRAFSWMAATFKQTMEEGFRLFTRAAQLRMTPGNLVAANEAAKATGLSAEEMEKLILRIEAGKTGQGNGGGRLKMFGDFAQLGALQDVFKAVVADSQRLGDVMNRTAGVFYNTTLALQSTNREWTITKNLIGEQMTGALTEFAADLKELLRSLNDTGTIEFFATNLGEALLTLEKVFGTVTLGIDVVLLGFKAIGTGLSLLVAEINNALVHIAPGKFTHIDLDPMVKELTDQAIRVNKRAQDIANNWDPRAAGRAVPVVALHQMSALPAGHWEKLGLSFGTSAAGDAAKQTARNTFRMAVALEKIVSRAGGGMHTNLPLNLGLA